MEDGVERPQLTAINCNLLTAIRFTNQSSKILTLMSVFPKSQKKFSARFLKYPRGKTLNESELFDDWLVKLWYL